MVLPLFGFAQDYPRFELYQLVQGQDSGQFVTTGVDSNLDFNSVLRFRFQDSTLLIGSDTVITDATIVQILLATIDVGLGIEVNQVNGQIFIESLSIEDSIYNGSGSIIAKGTPLYAADTQGNYWDVAPARADDPTKMPVVAIAGDEIGIGEVGLGLIKGHIKQVNTTGLADGSEVYVGATGGYTSTKPTDEGVIIQRLGTVIKGETTNGSGIINLGDEGFWNDYTSLTKLRDTLVLVRSSITTEIGDSLTNYASRTELQDTALAIRSDIPIYISDSLLNYVSRIELGDSLDLYPNRIELGDTALAIRADIPSLSGVVLTTTDQDIYGEKYFKNNIELDGALDMWINGNIYIGKFSGSDIRSTSVFDNVIIGTQAYFNGGYANDNTIIGDFAGYNTNGGGNVIIGASANDFYSPSVSVNVSNSVVLGYNANTSEETNTNSIVIGKDALGLGSNTAVIGNSSITKLNSNKYTFNVDQDTTGKDGQVLTFNSSSGEVELTQTGDVTTSQLADTASAIRADIPSTSTIVLSATIRDLDSDSVLLMTIPTEYIGCQIIETAQSFFANDFTGASGVFLGSISGSTFTNNGNLIAETVSGAVGYHHYVRNTTSGVYVYPYTITGTARFIRMNRPAATSGSAKAVTNTITIECNN